ncbi:CHAT domain-containing protein [Derxia lacustris]|uniref:CHAT domain-containing protein n=1 Tax=Derxia lacustris TaxID=764842 RepID=UPI000A16DBAB|nr:CHAT domain-containing protein [Derxia lacustris]
MSAPNAGSTYRFLVSGRSSDVASAAAPEGYILAEGVDVIDKGGRSEPPSQLTLEAQDGVHVVEVVIDGGPTLYLSPGNACALFKAQAGTTTRAAPVGAATDPDAVVVPTQLAWAGQQAAAGASRGTPASVGLLAVRLLGRQDDDDTDPAVDLGDLLRRPLARLGALLIAERIDRMAGNGVFRLDPTRIESLAGRPPTPISTADKPVLVFIHGTFSTTARGFGDLWRDWPDLLARLFKQYEREVYALDHPTLRCSPIENALTLVQALPEQGARLHLLTHSRGGLVAEVLVRICGVVGPRGLAGGDDASARQRALDDAADLLKAFSAGDASWLASVTGVVEAASSSFAKRFAELVELIVRKRPTVERVVRVACPARGTLLASGRLDAYLSVFAWLLGRHAGSVPAELVSFAAAIARERQRPEVLPGLWAQIPGSGLVEWLASVPPQERGLPGQLRVVAGYVEGDSVLSWVKTLLGDVYYRTPSDLVVNTDAMYGGTRRAGDASFFLDHGGKVDHGSYFSNESTAQAIASALIDETPAGFRPIGPLSWSGSAFDGVRGERRGAPAEDDPARPAVFVLPGIVGSNLRQGDRRLWLGTGFLNQLDALAWRRDGADGIVEDGPLGTHFDRLIAFLRASHAVVPFGFDWRVPMRQEAERLARAVDAALDRRLASGQPVRIVAHSMGGLLVRTMQLVAPRTWRRLMDHPQARLLMLGTPNGGSWAPMQVLSGDDSFGNTLVGLGAPFRQRQGREVMAGLPGFLQLQAGLLDPVLDLGREAGWRALAEEDRRRTDSYSYWHDEANKRGYYAWGIPRQEVLDLAVSLRRDLDNQLPELARDARKMLLVLGRAQYTPVGILKRETGIEYDDVLYGGDGRVSDGNAMLPGVRTWETDAAHSDLSRHDAAFSDYVSLLTTPLDALDDFRPKRIKPFVPAAARGGSAVPPLRRSRPIRDAASAAEPPVSFEAMFDGNPPVDGGPAKTPLRVRVLNDDLKFTGDPLLIGHYQAFALTGTEQAMDELLGGSLSAALRAGLYPNEVGATQVFRNCLGDPHDAATMPRPRALIVVGLGAEGQLTLSDLTQAVTQAALAQAQQERETLFHAVWKDVADRDEAGRQVAAHSFELAATLIGSGGLGVAAYGSAQAVARGVQAANQRLREIKWPLVARLTVVELYADRATEALLALQDLARVEDGDFDVDKRLTFGRAPLARMPGASYRGSNYDFIAARPVEGARSPGGRLARIEYIVDSRRARTEVRGVSAQVQLVEQIVREGVTQRGATASTTDVGRTLFRLLVPQELESFFVNSQGVVLEVDPELAHFPWELLDARPDGVLAPEVDVPWAVRTPFIRKLRLKDYREQPREAFADAPMLVIGEPATGGDPFGRNYASLPWARREAEEVSALFKGAKLLVDADARAVVMNLLAPGIDWRMVHVSGHGDAGSAVTDYETAGVVLTGGVRLGASEIKAMRRVPELVFINCCHTGAMSGEPGRFAASVAAQLIAIGVRCVIAAAWEVSDDGARRFAGEFYGALLAGQDFQQAVAAARRATWGAAPQDNTWAAYQCYGDPGWRLNPPASTEQRYRGSTRIVSPAGLVFELDQIAHYARFGGFTRASLRTALDELEAEHAQAWPGSGQVAHAFGAAWAALGNKPEALRWYRHALQTEDGLAPLRAVEQLGNLEARDAHAAAAGRNGDAAAARTRIRQAIEMLDRLVSFGVTSERASLQGSAWKRLAQLSEAEERSDAAARSLTHYEQAAELAARRAPEERFYPLIALVGARLVGAASVPTSPPAPSSPPGGSASGAPIDVAQALAQLREALDDKMRIDPDFWGAVGQIEVELLAAVWNGELAQAEPKLVDSFARLKQRVTAPGSWGSVAEQADYVLGECYRSDRIVDEADARNAAAALRLRERLRGFARD